MYLTRVKSATCHKNEAGDWVIINYQLGDPIELNSIGLSFAIEHVYRGLTLTSDIQTT